MTPDDLFAAIAVPVILIGAAVAVVLVRRSGQKRLVGLSPAFDFGTARKVGVFGLTVEGLFAGYSCRYSIQPASQHNPGGATLRLAVGVDGRWSADVASASARLLVKIGVLRDIDVGYRDPDFRLRFAGDDAAALQSLFSSEVVRVSFREVHATDNFSGVRLDTHGFEVRWSPRDPKLDEDPSILRRRLEVVTRFASACGYPPRFDA